MTGPRPGRHVPMRRCVVCRTVAPQAELIRFARDRQDAWRLDPHKKAGGRGAWVCRESACHQKKALGRAFKAQAARVAEQLAELNGSNGQQEQPQEKASQDGGIDV